MRLTTEEEFNKWVIENSEVDVLTSPLFLARCRFGVNKITGKISQIPNIFDVPSGSIIYTEIYDEERYYSICWEEVIKGYFRYHISWGGYSLKFKSPGRNIEYSNHYNDELRYFTTKEERDEYVRKFYIENQPEIVRIIGEELLSKRINLINELKIIDKKLKNISKQIRPIYEIK